MAAAGWPDGPIIETARLRLRPHRPGDLDDRHAMTGDAHVMRHFGGATQDREDNWHRLLRYAGHWALFGHGLLAIEERATGRFAGEVGLADFRRGLGADFDGAPEAAWMLPRWAEGRGYATEAMRAAIAWHEAARGPARMVCMIAPGNGGSLRVAAKLGFVPLRMAAYHEFTLLLHERRAPLPTVIDPR